jgi:hypothetical protein
MKKVVEILNKIKEKGLVEDYAIGGGIAAIFYTEPVFTYDLDVFVIPNPESSTKIISFTPIYNYLESKGYLWKGGHILIEGMPVQFLPASGELEHDAVKNGKNITYGGIATRVFSPEYLIAIALKVGRRKDFEKIGRLVDEAKIDNNVLGKILKKYHLLERFKQWKVKSK